MNKDKTVITPSGEEMKPIAPSENFLKLQKFSEKMASDIEYQQMLADNIKNNMFSNISLDPNDLPKFPSPEERLKFLTDKLDSMKEELENQTDSMRKIQYENMKLNAQIEVLNKTIDSNLQELNELRTVNSELKAVNKNLENNNKHYWRNTTIISIAVAIFSFIVGMYSTEVKEILSSVLLILQ